ncbi:MAG: CoA transferase [Chloroflexi bacterium]|nr:CoA transferase [Chloroflexota bacterium]
MAAPLEGITVVEVANWLAAPSAAALMADLGANVIKVEPPGGDTWRHVNLRAMGYQHDFALNYAFEVDNRGKRSITVDLDREGGPALVRRLAEGADVFITNLTKPRRERFGLSDAAVRERNPRVVYTSLTGYGTRGPDAERAGFDYSAFWARSGIMASLEQPPAPPPLNRGGQGDHTTSLNLLAAVLAALRLRDRTGEGQYVEVTLQATGMWTIAADFSAALASGLATPRHDRTQPPNPIWNSYVTADRRWLLLVMPQPDPYWEPFCRAIGEPELAADERYDSLLKRVERSKELTTRIAARFAQHDLAYWARTLDAHRLIWAPAAELNEVASDPQVRAMGWIARIEHPTAGPYETLATPFQIRGAEIGPRGPAPAIGEHTHDVLRELGLGDHEIATLAEHGVFG